MNSPICRPSACPARWSREGVLASEDLATPTHALGSGMAGDQIAPGDQTAGRAGGAQRDRGRRHALSAAHGERSLPPIRVSRWVGGGSRASRETLKPAMAAMSESPRNLRSWLAWPA